MICIQFMIISIYVQYMYIYVYIYWYSVCNAKTPYCEHQKILMRYSRYSAYTSSRHYHIWILVSTIRCYCTVSCFKQYRPQTLQTTNNADHRQCRPRTIQCMQATDNKEDADHRQYNAIMDVMPCSALLCHVIHYHRMP